MKPQSIFGSSGGVKIAGTDRPPATPERPVVFAKALPASLAPRHIPVVMQGAERSMGQEQAPVEVEGVSPMAVAFVIAATAYVIAALS